MNLQRTKGLLGLILVLFFSVSLFAQQRTVSGKVSDQEGNQPMGGVSINVKGTTINTVTNAEGKFSINVPSDKSVLLFTYVGYGTEEVKVGNLSTINVTLSSTNKKMDEVVVIGYGTVKKRDLTGSVSSVKASDIVKSPTSNPLEAIQGMVPGMDITRTSGKAGAGMNVQIRGTRTINGSSEPLYIIDGIQGGNISTLNPSDIESIDVLKDASSTAIYGSQGDNGVVIVTTKKGQAGKLKVNYSGYYGIDGWAMYPTPRTGQSYIDLRREAYHTTGVWNSPADDSKIFSSDELKAIDAGQWVNWMDLLMQNGIRQNHSLSLSGGNEKTNTYFSAGY